MAEYFYSSHALSYVFGFLYVRQKVNEVQTLRTYLESPFPQKNTFAKQHHLFLSEKQ